MDVYIKAVKHPRHCLANERAVLDALAATAIPVPRVLWYGEAQRATLVLEAMRGRMVWDTIDPRRAPYERDRVEAYLRAYGRCLGMIHSFPLAWEPPKRPRLNGLIGEENVADGRFVRGASPGMRPYRRAAMVRGN